MGPLVGLNRFLAGAFGILPQGGVFSLSPETIALEEPVVIVFKGGGGAVQILRS